MLGICINANAKLFARFRTWVLINHETEFSTRTQLDLLSPNEFLAREMT